MNESYGLMMKLKDFRPASLRTKLEDRCRQRSEKSADPVSRAGRRVLSQAGLVLVSILLVTALVMGMTAAWYSNVIRTTPLTVQSADWGFTGEINLTTAALTAAPGDRGVIAVTIKNDADRSADVRVDVRKDQMTAEMQKRIYCYTETTAGEGGTAGTKTYLNSRSPYIYRNIAAGDTLTLTEEGAPEGTPLLCWQWVYDVLGYYVLGTVTETDGVNPDGDPLTTVTLSADAEYLRPVEYDLDTALFDADGRLQSVQTVNEAGETLRQTAEELIGTLFTAWDADKTYDASTLCRGGYYALDVDENGCGVWLYLCSWTEIAEAAAYDTALGAPAEGEEAASFTLDLVFTGQNTPENP